MTLAGKGFPLAETAAGEVRGGRGRTLDEITLAAVLAGEVRMEDLRITPEVLRAQAAIARAAGRAPLAANFERAAELVAVPQEVIMATYELLRPGRAADRAALLERAAMLRRDYGAEAIARFIEAAAGHYHRRGIVGD